MIPTKTLLAGLVVVSSCLLPALAAPPPAGMLTFLPGDAQIGPAWGDQSSPDIALGTGSYLVVWSDARADEGRYDIYGIRLGGDGAPLDPVSFVIDEAHGSQTAPRVSWNGAHWLVVWLDEGTLVGVRVAPDGTVAGSPATIAAPGAGASVALASDGSGWAVVWAGTAAGNAAVRGSRIAADGTVLDPGGTVILPETYFVRSRLALAFSKDRYLLVWPESTADRWDDVLGHRLSRTLSKMEASPLSLAATVNSDGAPAVAGNGTEFYLVWKETDRNGWVNGLAGTRVNLSGVASTPEGTAIGDRRSWGDSPDVAWDGTQWIVSWTAGGAFAARISAAGTVRDPLGVQLASVETFDLRDAAIAAVAGGGARVAWQDYRNHRENDVWSGSVSAGGLAGPDAAVSLSLPSQQSPRIAWNGNGYAVAFVSETSDQARILVQRLDASGVPIDAQPAQVATGNVHAVGLAWSGSRYLVTWRERGGSRLYARRLGPDLSLQDAAPIDVMPGENPAVAALGDVFLVTGEYATYYPNRALYVQRIDGATGAKLGDRRMVPGGFPWATAAGAIGGRWIVAFESHYSHNDTLFTLAYAFVGADGVPQTSYGLVGGSGWGTSGVAIASHPELGAIAYSTSRAPSASNGEIYVLRVAADAGMPDGFTGVLLSDAAPGEQLSPAIAWNGAEFFTAFQDQRTNPGIFSFPKSDVYAARLGADGALLDPGGGFAVEATPAPEFRPAVAGANGTTIVAAVHLRGEAVGALRVGLRPFGGSPAPAPPVSGVAFASRTSMVWTPAENTVLYDVLRGDLATLRSNGAIGDASCVDDDLPAASRQDPEMPLPGAAFYYLVRSDAPAAPAGSFDDPAGSGQAHDRDDDVGTAGGSACGG